MPPDVARVIPMGSYMSASMTCFEVRGASVSLMAHSEVMETWPHAASDCEVDAASEPT